MAKTWKTALLLLLALVPAVGAAPQEPRYMGPLVIYRGGVYRGNWQSLNPNVPAVTVRTSAPVVIEHSNIRGRGALIYSAYRRANITVRASRGVALNPGRPLKEQRYPGRFLHLEEFASATVENNELVGTSGMYFRDFQGSARSGQTIRVLRNRALNIDGRYSTSPSAFSAEEAHRVQFVQFDHVKNIADAEIAWNEVINEPGQSRPEENISMYLSSGRPENAIKIHDNYIQGAYAALPQTQSYAGGGMNLGDGTARDPSDAASFIHAYRNQVVGTSNVGIAVSAGHDIRVFDNRLVSSGYLPGKTATIAGQNVGLYVWDANGDHKTGSFYNISVYSNTVGWAQPRKSRTAQNPFWFPDCSPGACERNTVLPGPITQTMERQEFARWQNKRRMAAVVIGLDLVEPSAVSGP